MRSAASCRSQCQRSQPRWARAQARHQGDALQDDPERRPEPEEDDLGVVVLEAGQGGAPPRHEAEPDQDPDADQVVDDRGPGDGDEAPLRVEQGGGQREETVGGDLDHEPAQQGGGVGALDHDGVNELGVRRGIERGQGRDERGGQHQRGHRRHSHDDYGDREHGRNGGERLLLGAVGQLVDKDRDERGREHAAQHDVVEHVGGGIGQVEGVGQV